MENSDHDVGDPFNNPSELTDSKLAKLPEDTCFMWMGMHLKTPTIAAKPNNKYWQYPYGTQIQNHSEGKA